MATKRIHTTTSRTAEMNCLYRALSSLEADAHYHSDKVVGREKGESRENYRAYRQKTGRLLPR